jgi:hypothetical protein
MAQSPEDKVAEQLVNLTESHWFNPASMARYIANQPLYTTDRIMELVTQIIRHNSARHEQESVGGYSSDGLILANELYYAIQAIQEHTEFDNLEIPI